MAVGVDARTGGDLDRRDAVRELVVDFYRAVAVDDVIGPIFTEVARVDWSAHIPKLVDYWCRVLLGEPGYEGNLLGAHQHVHDREPFTPEHFRRWYELWVQAIDARWSGPYADRAKRHAARIGDTLARRLPGDTGQHLLDAPRLVRPHTRS
ncbi:MAG TPA: group III truncated hemoglobin [Acidimicrobiales bacterium]